MNPIHENDLLLSNRGEERNFINRFLSGVFISDFPFPDAARLDPDVSIAVFRSEYSENRLRSLGENRKGDTIWVLFLRVFTGVFFASLPSTSGRGEFCSTCSSVTLSISGFFEDESRTAVAVKDFVLVMGLELAERP